MAKPLSQQEILNQVDLINDYGQSCVDELTQFERVQIMATIEKELKSCYNHAVELDAHNSGYTGIGIFGNKLTGIEYWLDSQNKYHKFKKAQGLLVERLDSIKPKNELGKDSPAKNAFTTREEKLQASKEYFNEIDSLIAEEYPQKQWSRFFSHEHDYRAFAQLMANMRAGLDFSPPDQPIRAKPSTMTPLATFLKALWKRQGEGHVKDDIGFLDVVKCLNHFSQMPTRKIVDKINRSQS